MGGSNLPHTQDSRHCGIQANVKFFILRPFVHWVIIGPSTYVATPNPFLIWVILVVSGRASVFVRSEPTRQEARLTRTQAGWRTFLKY